MANPPKKTPEISHNGAVLKKEIEFCEELIDKSLINQSDSELFVRFIFSRFTKAFHFHYLKRKYLEAGWKDVKFLSKKNDVVTLKFYSPFSQEDKEKEICREVYRLYHKENKTIDDIAYFLFNERDYHDYGNFHENTYSWILYLIANGAD